MTDTQANLTALCDATIFTGEQLEENRALLIKGGKVVDIVTPDKIPVGAHKISCGGHILAPGFIDAQVNGGGNILFNNTPTPDACIAIAKAHRGFGTTRILITCVSDTPEVTANAVSAMRDARKQDASILGIHIEGPHLGNERRGVHKAEFLREMSEKDLQLYHREGDEVMLITVAPENVTPQQIKTLRQQGAIVSLGHTSANAGQIQAALAAGATGFTHLYNGMGKPNADGPVPADSALADKESWCGLIADGFHVSKELILLALRTKPEGKIFLVSDAMPPAASDNPKPFKLYGEAVRVENGRCVNSEGKLAGSSITLADAVKHCVNNIGVDLAEALRMASLYPANFLGIDRQFGKLLPGYAADVVMLDKVLNPVKTWISGGL